MTRQSYLGIGMAAAAGAALGVGMIAGADKLLADAMGRAHRSAAEKVFPVQACGLPAIPVRDEDVRARMETASMQMAERVSAWLDSADAELVALPVDGGRVRLCGTIVYASRATRDWVVLAHEYRANRRSMEKFGEMYARHGFNVLNVDLRGHGDSEGDYITMGWDDGQDILDWVGYLVSRFGSDIRVVLHGQSMGAASVLHAAGASSRPQLVALVADSCGSKMKDALLKSLGQANVFPPVMLYAMLRAAALLRCGFDLSKDNPIDFAHGCTVPTLFIHGAADTLVPPAQSAELYSACPAAMKKLIVIPEAGHLGGVFVGPKHYEEELFDFLARVGVVQGGESEASNDWM